jgi:hypothetical protein
LPGVPNFWNVVSEYSFHRYRCVRIAAISSRSGTKREDGNLNAEIKTPETAHTTDNRDDRKGLDIEGKTTLTYRNASEEK